MIKNFLTYLNTYNYCISAKMSYHSDNLATLKFMFQNRDDLDALEMGQEVIFDGVPIGLAPLISIIDEEKDNGDRQERVTMELQRLGTLPVISLDAKSNVKPWLEVSARSDGAEHIVRKCLRGSTVYICDILQEQFITDFLDSNNLDADDVTSINVVPEPETSRLYIQILYLVNRSSMDMFDDHAKHLVQHSPKRGRSRKRSPTPYRDEEKTLSDSIGSCKIEEVLTPHPDSDMSDSSSGIRRSPTFPENPLHYTWYPPNVPTMKLPTSATLSQPNQLNQLSQPYPSSSYPSSSSSTSIGYVAPRPMAPNSKLLNY